MNGIWDDYREELEKCEGVEAEAVFIDLMSETRRHDTPNVKRFTDLYNWYTAGIEDGMYQFFAYEERTLRSLDGLGAVIAKYFTPEANAVYQRCVKELMPMVYAEMPDSEVIDALSAEIDAYFSAHETELLHSIKEYLLAEGDKIAAEINWA